MVSKLRPYGAIILLIGLTYGIGQLYELTPDTVVNYFPFADKPMPASWYVKFLSEEVNRIIEAVVAVLGLRMIKPMLKNQRAEAYRVLSITARVYLIYRSADIVYWFLSFKQLYYWTIFLLVFLVEKCIYKVEKIKHNIWYK